MKLDEFNSLAERDRRRLLLVILGVVSALLGILLAVLSISQRSALLSVNAIRNARWSVGLGFYLAAFAAAALLFIAFMCLRRAIRRRHWQWRHFLLLVPMLGSSLAAWADLCLLSDQDYFLNQMFWLPAVNAMLSWLAFPLLRKKGIVRILAILALLLPTLFLVKAIYYTASPSGYTPDSIVEPVDQ